MKTMKALLQLVCLLLGGIGLLVTLLGTFVSFFNPDDPGIYGTRFYWLIAFGVCLICAIVLRTTEWGKRELATPKKRPEPDPKLSTEKGYAPANPNAKLNRAAIDTTPDKVKKAQRKAGVRCPKCGSTDVTLLNNTKSSLSAGKALVGDVVAGAPGMVVGAAMGRKGKREYICNHCGHRYSVKN